MSKSTQNHWDTVYKTKDPNQVSWTQKIPKTSYSKAKKLFITKCLIAKRQNGYLGEQSLQFYLPDKKGFYSITTRLGE